MTWETKNYQPSRWMKFFYHEEGGVNGFGLAATTTEPSDVTFSGPWMLENIVVNFSTGNASNCSFTITAIHKMSASMNLLSTHSLYMVCLMSWQVSDSITHSLWDSQNSTREFYFQSGDRIHFSYSMDSGVNNWTIDVEGWAVLGI